MTAKESSAWLEYRAKQTGKSVEELREEMRQRGAKANNGKGYFATLTIEQRKEISQRGVEGRKNAKENRTS